jgi:exosortase/archaeosortase
MADIFDSGLSALKLITKVYEIKIDNGTFKLFYKATTAILLACSFISSSKQFFGTPISCEVVRSKQTFLISSPLIMTESYKKLSN